MAIKHAFLIGAYKNPDYLLRLINSLDTPNSNLYIHVNNYNDKDFAEFKKQIAERDNINFYSIYKIKWGGSNLFFSQMFLLEEALKNNDNAYFHFITGQDALIRPVKDFMAFVEDSKANFITYRPFPSEEYNHRYSYYSLWDFCNISSSRLKKKCNALVIKVQKFFKFKRTPFKYKIIYWGSSWWSLRRDACLYVMAQWKDNKKLQKRVKYTFAPDEMLIQTILLNADNEFTIINDNLRFLKWEGKPSPKTLKLEDYDDVIKSGKYFGRKVDPIESASFLKCFDNI